MMCYMGIMASCDDSHSGERPQDVVPFYHNLEGVLNHAADERLSSITTSSLDVLDS